MKNNVIHIFLDIDGVIATRKAFNKKWKDFSGFEVGVEDLSSLLEKNNTRFPPLSMDHWPFDTKCCTSIHRLQLKYRKLGYDVRYVISSSWRTGRTIEELDDLFILKGLILDSIVDKTGRSESRGQEINEWLEENDGLDTPFIVIDDECNYDIKQHIDDKHLIDTKFYSGFNIYKEKEAYKKINAQISK